MPGRGTLKGGTMTGGNPGIGAAGCGTVWGNATGRGGGPVVMATVTVGGLTAAIGVAMALGVVVTTDGISTTSWAARSNSWVWNDHRLTSDTQINKQTNGKQNNYFRRHF